MQPRGTRAFPISLTGLSLAQLLLGLSITAHGCPASRVVTFGRSCSLSVSGLRRLHSTVRLLPLLLRVQVLHGTVRHLSNGTNES